MTMTTLTNLEFLTLLKAIKNGKIEGSESNDDLEDEDFDDLEDEYFDDPEDEYFDDPEDE